MSVLRGVKAEKNDKVCLPKGGNVVEGKSVFGKYDDSEMLFQLKALALNHCEPGVSRDSIRPLWDQTLQVRKLMALSDTEFPRRKRKLQQFLKDKFKSATELVSEASNQQNVSKLSRGQISHASSASCVLNTTDFVESLHERILLNSHSSGSLLTSEDNFQRQLSSSGFPILDNAKDGGPSNKTTFLFVDTDGSVNGSNPITPEHMTLQESTSLDLDHSSDSLNLEESKGERLDTPRQSIRLLNFIGDHLQRMAIPIGPRFQADVLEWSGSPSEVYINGRDGDSNSSRWLGTQVWPIEGQNVKTTARVVGKGRPNSCSCVSQGSIDCVKRHILEERLILQFDLGPVFFNWKFDEMGEEVSKSWTLKEQESFDLLAKTNLQSSGKNFLKHAMKCFPSKCKKDIMSFYFNVFIPRRMSLQNRSLVKQVDGDVDAVKDVYNLNLRKTQKDRTSLVGICKDVKTRYMRRS